MKSLFVSLPYRRSSSSTSSYYINRINNRQPKGSLSNVLSRLAVVVRDCGPEIVDVGHNGKSTRGKETGRRHATGC
jgi:hypothetical protein